MPVIAECPSAAVIVTLHTTAAVPIHNISDVQLPLSRLGKNAQKLQILILSGKNLHISFLEEYIVHGLDLSEYSILCSLAILC